MDRLFFDDDSNRETGVIDLDPSFPIWRKLAITIARLVTLLFYLEAAAINRDPDPGVAAVLPDSTGAPIGHGPPE
jgi:hypothetical protein